MKRTIKILIAMYLILTSMMSVSANSFSTTISNPGDIVPGQEFNVNLGVSGASNWQAIQAALKYDSTKLRIVSHTYPSDLVGEVGPTVTAEIRNLNNPKSGSFTFLTVRFRALSGFTVGQSTNISLENVRGTVNLSDVTGAGSSRRITMVAPKSTNNYLRSLSVTPGSLSFRRTTTSYTVIVDHEVTSVNIAASAEDSKARVSGTGNKNLDIYSNEFNIVVTAESGARRTYRVNVVRRDADGNAGELSKNNNLASLTVEGCEIDFSVEVLAYNCEVDNLVEEVEVDATLEDEKAELEIINPALQIGQNEILFNVKAESGDEKTYTVFVFRSGSAPTVPFDTLIEALDRVQSDELAAFADPSGMVTPQILNALKAARKTLFIKQVVSEGVPLYQWKFVGSQINETSMVNTNLVFESTRSELYAELTNHALGKILNFESNPTLPNGTQVGIYVADMYRLGDVLRLYYFNRDSERFELYHEDLVVEGDYVWIPLQHTSEYFLTRSEIKSANPTDIWFMIALIEGGVLIILIIAIIIAARKINNMKYMKIST